MNLIQRLHEFATKLGVSPKVFDPFVGAVAAVATNWAITGRFDFSGLKLAGILVLLGALGFAAPPVAAATTAGLARVNRKRR